MKPDVILGLAAGYSWEQLRPFAHSLVRSGFTGRKVLFTHELESEAEEKLRELDFILLPLPEIPFSNPDIAKGKFFPYVGRFLLFSQFLRKYADEFRYAIFSDTRDVVFFKNPSEWLENNAGDMHKIVAASEFILHKNQQHNAAWVDQCFREMSKWFLEQPVYCSGFISGHADYMADLAAGIYLVGRELSGYVWGSDQPAYNSLIHQAAYRDVTLEPTMRDKYCLNLAIWCMPESRAQLYDPEAKKANEEGVVRVDLREFCAVHQYDRFPELTKTFQEHFAVLD